MEGIVYFIAQRVTTWLGLMVDGWIWKDVDTRTHSTRPRRDLNAQSSASETDALSIRPQGHSMSSPHENLSIYLSIYIAAAVTIG